MSQRRLPGTVPPVDRARDHHKEAIAKVRALEKTLDEQKDAMAEIRAALKLAEKERRNCEDELEEAERLDEQNRQRDGG